MRQTIFMLAILAVVPTVDAEQAAFTDAPQFERVCDRSPASVREAIEAVCSQEQIDAIMDLVLPEPTPEEKAAMLRQAQELLVRAGASQVAEQVTPVLESVELDLQPAEELPAEPSDPAEAS